MKKWNLGIIGLVMVALTSCETDVDLIQDYESNSFVFGLLDQHADTQYVRINRAFLGTLNIQDMANVNDSINYSSGDLKVEVNLKTYLNRQDRISISRNETYELKELLVSKDQGFFNNDDYIVYYFTEPIVQEETNNGISVPANYQLYITNQRTGKVDSANAPIQLVSDVSLTRPNPNSSTATLGKYTTSGNQLNPEYDIEWFSTENAVKHEVYARFYYDEITLSNQDTSTYSFDYFVGNEENFGGNSSLRMSTSLSPINLFREISQQLEVKTGIQRIRPRIRFYMIIANQDYSLFIDASSPSDDINQNKPSYSNMSNGIGIFGARSNHFVNSRFLNFNQESLELLISLPETRDLSFKQI